MSWRGKGRQCPRSSRLPWALTPPRLRRRNRAQCHRPGAPATSCTPPLPQRRRRAPPTTRLRRRRRTRWRPTQASRTRRRSRPRRRRRRRWCWARRPRRRRRWCPSRSRRTSTCWTSEPAAGRPGGGGFGLGRPRGRGPRLLLRRWLGRCPGGGQRTWWHGKGCFDSQKKSDGIEGLFVSAFHPFWMCCTPDGIGFVLSEMAMICCAASDIYNSVS
mmetsp:Transcript_17765/g.26814  ORF Transcript_17765/g.26814 Transcript_17765/m.26814 type:complete len:216 (+) Transcript_17765:1072-1719(+)